MRQNKPPASKVIDKKLEKSRIALYLCEIVYRYINEWYCNDGGLAPPWKLYILKYKDCLVVCVYFED